jgi:hypothetical protein
VSEVPPEMLEMSAQKTQTVSPARPWFLQSWFAANAPRFEELASLALALPARSLDALAV